CFSLPCGRWFPISNFARDFVTGGKPPSLPSQSASEKAGVHRLLPVNRQKSVINLQAHRPQGRAIDAAAVAAPHGIRVPRSGLRAFLVLQTDKLSGNRHIPPLP